MNYATVLSFLIGGLIGFLIRGTRNSVNRFKIGFDLGYRIGKRNATLNKEQNNIIIEDCGAMDGMKNNEEC